MWQGILDVRGNNGWLRRRVHSGVALVVATLFLPSTAMAATTKESPAPPSAVKLSEHPIPATRAWEPYVEAPQAVEVRPLRVVTTTGEVTNPNALLAGGSGQTTLTYPSGGTAPTLVLDYGRDVGGYVNFTVASAPGPTTLQASYSEALYNLSPSGDGGTGGVQSPVRQLVPVAGPGSGSPSRQDQFSVTGPGPLVSQGIQGGERFEMVTLTKPGTLTLSAAGIRYTAFDGVPGTYQGWFLSSSRLVNRIWYAGAYTVNLATVQPGTQGYVTGSRISTPNIIDGAKRDRNVWIGDLVVSDVTALDAFGSNYVPYVKGSLSLIGNYPEAAPALLIANEGSPNLPGPMPGYCSGNDGAPCSFYSATYSMDYVLAVCDYFERSGDIAFLQAYWPLVKRELAWENSQIDPSNGLFQMTAADSADWDTNVTHTNGDYAAPSILHYASLLDGAVLADAIGDGSLAASYRSDALTTKNAINSNLWDPTLGAYDASTGERGFLVQDANVWAVLYGVATADRSAQILATLARGLNSPYGMLDFQSGAGSDYLLQLVSPYIGSFALDADYANGRSDLAMALMQREWGWMINHGPGGTDWERIETNGRLASADSAAHGWGTGATSALSEYVLGIQPLTTGFGTWRIEPETYGLGWAEGQIPTPHGPIVSRWRIRAGSFTLTAESPSSTSGVVEIPLLGRPRTIAEDGHVVWRSQRPVAGTTAAQSGGFVAFDNVFGSHTFAWAR